MYIILNGNMSDGYEAIGPFPTFDKAAEYSYANALGLWSWIMSVKKPPASTEAEDIESTILKCCGHKMGWCVCNPS